MSLEVVNYLSIKLDGGSLSNIKGSREKDDFYEKALLKSNNCHILVTNHAMVMTEQERKQPSAWHLVVQLISR